MILLNNPHSDHDYQWVFWVTVVLQICEQIVCFFVKLWSFLCRRTGYNCTLSVFSLNVGNFTAEHVSVLNLFNTCVSFLNQWNLVRHWPDEHVCLRHVLCLWWNCRTLKCQHWASWAKFHHSNKKSSYKMQSNLMWSCNSHGIPVGYRCIMFLAGMPVLQLLGLFLGFRLARDTLCSNYCRVSQGAEVPYAMSNFYVRSAHLWISDPKTPKIWNLATYLPPSWCYFSLRLQILHCVSKKFPPLNSLSLCQILTYFQIFCTAGKHMKFATPCYSPVRSHLSNTNTRAVPCHLQLSLSSVLAWL